MSFSLFLQLQIYFSHLFRYFNSNFILKNIFLVYSILFYNIYLHFICVGLLKKHISFCSIYKNKYSIFTALSCQTQWLYDRLSHLSPNQKILKKSLTLNKSFFHLQTPTHIKKTSPLEVCFKMFTTKLQPLNESLNTKKTKKEICYNRGKIIEK